MTQHQRSEFTPLRNAAAKLGLSPAWLKAQVKAGSVPAIVDGNKILVHMEDAKEALRQIAKSNPAAKPEGDEA